MHWQGQLNKRSLLPLITGGSSTKYLLGNDLNSQLQFLTKIITFVIRSTFLIILIQQYVFVKIMFQVL
jgi:hypothetical protein